MHRMNKKRESHLKGLQEDINDNSFFDLMILYIYIFNYISIYITLTKDVHHT